MKLFLGVGLTLGGLCGIAVSLLGNTVVSSGLYALNGQEISLAMGAFSVVATLGGIYTLFAS